MHRLIGAVKLFGTVTLCALLVLSAGQAAANPGEEPASPIESAGASLARGVRGVLSAIDDVRGRAGVRRIPLIGKFWRPKPSVVPPLYDQLFPHFVQVCTMTQYVRVFRDAQGKVVGREKGGWGGHATMFLNGACLDGDASYPRLTLCPEGQPATDGTSGVGVSVNQVFENVNWMAFPGRDFFFYGNLRPGEMLDEGRFEKMIDEAAGSGLFDGIEMRDKAHATEGSTSGSQALVSSSIGTDFALSLSRTAYCSRLPLPRPVLGVVIEKLNDLNEQYVLTGKAYEWDLVQDNCSHAIHNALATAGVWDAKLTRLGKVEQFTRGHGRHISFPFNTVVALAEAGNHGRIDSVVEAFEDEGVRRTFDRFGWIATGAGALVETLPIRAEERNRLFIEGDMPFAGSVPIDPTYALRRAMARRIQSTLNTEKRFREIFSRREYTDLLENLEAYRDRYTRVLKGRNDPVDSYGAYRTMDHAERSEFRSFRERFFSYMQAELADVDRMIGRYHETSSVAPGPAP